LAKRLSEKDKIILVKEFTEGKSLDYLSEKFNFAKLTISRNLKKTLGEKKYKDLLIRNKEAKTHTFKTDFPKDEINDPIKTIKNGKYTEKEVEKNKLDEDDLPLPQYMELIPLDYDFENEHQKDLSSIPIKDINFPKTVFMIIEKDIELATKYLEDYPEWQFLSQDELKRKTIRLYSDLKLAKRFCKKEQKVIKVPNTEVFKIVAPILVSRGITRIVSDEQLIAL